jgi:hypothetical protein
VNYMHKIAKVLNPYCIIWQFYFLYMLKIPKLKVVIFFYSMNHNKKWGEKDSYEP